MGPLMDDVTPNEPTPRRAARPLTLIRRAAGSPRQMIDKTGRFASILAAYVNSAELDARLGRLFAKGVIDVIPSRIQMAVGAADVLRFWITPAAADYYEKMGLNFTFHQVLRFLDEPASLVDPVGLFSTRDGIIGHLLQVVHANPLYDFELLQMFDDGLAELEDQTRAMIAGTHPRAASIGAIVEEPDYHARLLDFVVAYRADRRAIPPLRSNIEEGFADAERFFGAMRTTMRYFAHMPTTVAGAIHHLRTVDALPYYEGIVEAR